MDAETQRKKSPDYGGFLGYKIFHIVIALFGIRAAYVLLVFIVPYYVFIRRSACVSASFYLKRRFPGDGPFRRRFRAFRYFYSFGQILIDQAVVGILGRKMVSFDFPDGDDLLMRVRSPKGLILQSSHFGNWQTAMSTMGIYGSMVYFHFLLENHTSGRHFFDLANERGNFKIIPPSGFLGGAVELTNCLLEGSSVALMGDRAWGAKTVRHDFLGYEALFPVTPYHLAYATGADLVMLLAVRTGPMRFRIEALSLNEGLDMKEMKKDEAVSLMLGRYISSLEEHLERYPYQWLNFYDFWSEKDETVRKT